MFLQKNPLERLKIFLKKHTLDNIYIFFKKNKLEKLITPMSASLIVWQAMRSSHSHCMSVIPVQSLYFPDFWLKSWIFSLFLQCLNNYFLKKHKIGKVIVIKAHVQRYLLNYLFVTQKQYKRTWCQEHTSKRLIHVIVECVNIDTTSV